MKNLNQIKKRYLKEPFDRKIGHLASDLARISTFIENSFNEKAVMDILAESKFFIEWAAPEATLEIQEFLSEMQSRLALWHYRLSQNKKTPSELERLKETTKSWSKHLIEISGLLVV